MAACAASASARRDWLVGKIGDAGRIPSERAAGQNCRKTLHERNFSGVRGRQAKVPVRIAVVQCQRQ